MIVQIEYYDDNSIHLRTVRGILRHHEMNRSRIPIYTIGQSRPIELVPDISGTSMTITVDNIVEVSIPCVPAGKHYLPTKDEEEKRSRWDHVAETLEEE